MDDDEPRPRFCMCGSLPGIVLDCVTHFDLIQSHFVPLRVNEFRFTLFCLELRF